MIKLNKKGFFLTETIVVTGIVATVLVLLYSQVSSLYRSYERNSQYDTVESIHAVRNIKIYLEQNYTPDLLTDLSSSATPLLDITSYDFDATGHYDALLDASNVSKVYFSSYNINNLITNYASYDISASFLDYLRTLRVSDEKADTYRIIVLLNNGNYANIYFPISDLT